MEDFIEIDRCTSISELIDKEIDVKMQIKEVDEKFNSLYQKVDNEGDNYEAIISVNNSTKTAVITPIIRKKYLVDYESSETEEEDNKESYVLTTPYPKISVNTPKPKRQRMVTPHIKKFLGLSRQNAIKEYDETPNVKNSDIPATDMNDTKTPSRKDQIPITDDENKITTPTSIAPHIMKLVQTVTTSTPTNPITCDWSLFPAQGNDSPLSEIETTESPAGSIDKESLKLEDNLQPKLKSIIVSDSKIRFGSQDSLDKQTNFQDSDNNESSTKTKKVTFANDTIFKQEAKVKRVLRKPKRMLTPGRPRPRQSYNPRFQALINRFETQKTVARTEVQNSETKEADIKSTPPTAEHNIPRAISFKDDSPAVQADNSSKESNELFKTCDGSPTQPINKAISALSANIAGSLQTCLSSVLRTSDEETEIQFKFVITKKKVSVKRVASEIESEKKLTETDDEELNKENIWATVARVVKNVFWGNQATPNNADMSNESSGTKRKFEELSDSDASPINHKRHKYEGRIKGRPPLRRSKSCNVSYLQNSQSADHTFIRNMSMSQEDNLNLSF